MCTDVLFSIHCNLTWTIHASCISVVDVSGKAEGDFIGKYTTPTGLTVRLIFRSMISFWQIIAKLLLTELIRIRHIAERAVTRAAIHKFVNKVSCTSLLWKKWRLRNNWSWFSSNEGGMIWGIQKPIRSDYNFQFGPHFSFPWLQEYFMECTPQQRPLLVLHALHNLKFRQVLCFTNSVESTHRFVWQLHPQSKPRSIRVLISVHSVLNFRWVRISVHSTI